jgi:hypothetical protein
MRQSLVSLFILGSALNLSSFSAVAQYAPAPSAGSGFSIPSTTPSSTPSTTDVYFINRAKNLARQAAITANGGLERYRPDPVMFGPAVQTQFVRNADGSITFSFTGGAPGASPSLETVATVVPSGSVKLDYNGPLRNGGAGFAPVTNQTLPIQTPVQIPVPSSAPKLNPASGFPSLPKLPSSSPTSIPPLPVASIPAASTPLPRTVVGNGNSPGPNWVNEDAFFSKARNLARQSAIKANGGLTRYRPEPAMFGPSAQTPAVKNANGSITFTFKGGAPNTSDLTTQSVVTVDPAGTVNLEYNGPVR